MKRKTIIDGIVRILGTAVALAAFYGLFSAFVVMARDAGEPERREIMIDLPGAGAPVEGVEFAEDINVPSKWISVKDRLPEKETEVLVRDRVTGEITTAHLNDLNHFVFRDGRGHGASHWMPLPKYPKEVAK